MTARPWSQGDDNGLCGLLAVVNAFRWLFPELRRKDAKGEERCAPMMPAVVRDGLDGEAFKSLYLDGDELPLVKRIAEMTRIWVGTNITDDAAVRLSTPFAGNPPSDHRIYWRRLIPLIEPGNTVAIIGLEQPWPHWTVVTNMRGPYRARLFDSDVFKSLDIRRTVVGKTNGRTWELDPPAVLTIQRP